MEKALENMILSSAGFEIMRQRNKKLTDPTSIFFSNFWLEREAQKNYTHTCEVRLSFTHLRITCDRA
jgi:hypothetical protein